MIGYEQIQQEAAQWVAREDRGLTADESQAMAVWLDAATSNRIAYLRLKALWDSSARLAALQNSARFSDRSTPLPWMRLAAAAVVMLAVAGGIGGVIYFNSRPQQITYATDIGERPILRLSDGTRIQLNTNSSVRTSITRATRTVTLEKGEAYFEVIHDASRPFVVFAGNRKITDLGTKFSVRRDGDKVYVVVKEGRVRVDAVDDSAPSAPVDAVQGNVVLAKANEVLVAPKSSQDMSDDLSWRDGMLVFNQKTLGDAADEFNRYNRKHLIVSGSARDIRIGGRFRADNIDVFSLLVSKALGLKVAEEPDRIVISQ